MTAEMRFDFQRMRRVGLTEAVLCEGKTAAQVALAIAGARVEGAPLLLTRLAPALADALPAADRAALDYDGVSRTAILGPWSRPESAARVAVVTAGTSDVPVAREAVRTLAFHDVRAKEFIDVGVAGLWRILEIRDALAAFRVVIVVAGMDGALFSVVAGLVPGLVIAVPTSIGYGVADGGRTALNAALASCAPGLVVTNIDNGYGAACAALRRAGADVGATPQTR